MQCKAAPNITPLSGLTSHPVHSRKQFQEVGLIYLARCILLSSLIQAFGFYSFAQRGLSPSPLPSWHLHLGVYRRSRVVKPAFPSQMLVSDPCSSLLPTSFAPHPPPPKRGFDGSQQPLPSIPRKPSHVGSTCMCRLGEITRAAPENIWGGVSFCS